MNGRNAVIILVILGALAAGSAFASRAGTTLTINSANVTANWREGWFKGSVTLSATVSASSQLEVTFRSQSTHQLVAKPLNFAASGNFTKTFKLGARPTPGTYTLKITGTSTGTTLPSAERLLTVPNPDEGVVDRWYTSRTKDGRSIHVVPGAHQIYARFHFLTPPKARVVKFIWRRPDYHFVGAKTKRYQANVWTFVRAKKLPHGYADLQKGTWYCIMRASGKVSKRVSVRVT